VSQPGTKGAKAEEWVRDFARQYRILNTTLFSLEKVVPLLENQLQYKLALARPYVRQEFAFANEWIDSIISNKKVLGNTEEKAKLAEQLLDLCAATDILLRLKDNRGTEHLIAADVASNPGSEQKKLDIIRGKKDPKDAPGFNRNHNLGQVRQILGITKHLVLVINPDNPPNQEQLLNRIYAFANQPTKTGTINVWAPALENQKATQTQTPRQLWHKYNEGVTANGPIQRQIAIATKALEDGQEAKLPDILACDPFVQKVQREQGTQKARNHIATVINAVTRKNQASQQAQRSPQKEQGRDIGPEL